MNSPGCTALVKGKDNASAPRAPKPESSAIFSENRTGRAAKLTRVARKPEIVSLLKESRVAN
jgi:hypothetical protein